MAHFTQPHTSVRAPRVRIPQEEPVWFTYEGGRVQGTLQKISVTGGLAVLPKQIAQGTIAEMKVKSTAGPITGIVELLDPRIHRGAPQQAFKFIAMDDTDHDRLAAILESLKSAGAA